SAKKKRPKIEQTPAIPEDWASLILQLEREIKLRQYSPKTLSSYRSWLYRFARFSGSLPVMDVSAETAKAFLTSLAVDDKVAASTQQAFAVQDPTSLCVLAERVLTGKSCYLK
ncbi:MAG: phage integrase N-terminal SAM-like domain-containing protein, partial [Verrucomicrobiota bacterium]